MQLSCETIMMDVDLYLGTTKNVLTLFCKEWKDEKRMYLVVYDVFCLVNIGQRRSDLIL